MAKKDETITADDGLVAPIVGAHSHDKYKLIGHYAEIFSKGMKGLWQSRVYIDLYAGAGRAQVKETAQFVDTSAVLALKVSQPFDQYIFSDLNKEKLDALKARAEKAVPSVNAKFIHGDANLVVPQILNAIPQHNANFKVLGFCVIDPFNTGNFAFETIEALSKKFMDFLVLLPTCMDAKRNLHNYFNADNVQLDKFLGNPDWRQEWEEFLKMDDDFAHFMVDRFIKKMVGLGFLDSMKYVKAVSYQEGRKNVLLYHLAFFSKHQRGLDFWKKSLEGTTQQTSLLENI